jgi:hypothetical protein
MTFFKYNIFFCCFVTDSNRFIILSKYSSLRLLYHLYLELTALKETDSIPSGAALIRNDGINKTKAHHGLGSS